MEQGTTTTGCEPLEDLLNKADEYARREPAKAVVSAFGAGFLINLLPIGFIVGALATLALKMAKPILLLLGVLKAIDLANTRPGRGMPHH